MFQFGAELEQIEDSLITGLRGRNTLVVLLSTRFILNLFLMNKVQNFELSMFLT